MRRFGAPVVLAVLTAAGAAQAQTGDSGVASDPDASTAATPPDAETTGATPTDPTNPVQPATSPGVVLVDTAPLVSVDPAAATFVTDQVRRQLQALGYSVVPTQTMYGAARELSLHFPVPPTELPALMSRLAVSVAVAVELGAANGYYRATIRVRMGDELQERVRVVFASQWTLGDVVRSTVSQLLGANPTTYTPQNPVTTTPLVPGLVLPNLYGARPAQRRRPAHLHARLFDLSLGGAAAVGIVGQGESGYVNGLVGLRAAVFPLDRLGFTLSVEYANLRGRTPDGMEVNADGSPVRVNNVLLMSGIETAVELFRIGTRGRRYVTIPLRLEAGYLPYNGAVLRATGAVGIPITSDIRAELDLLQPTIWFLPGYTAVTFNFGASLVIGFGARPSPPASTGSTAPASGAAQPEADSAPTTETSQSSDAGGPPARPAQ